MVLVAVAKAIQVALGPSDFCARLGGEEFCAVLPEINSDEELTAIAERVRVAIRAVRPSLYPTLQVTASIGAFRVPDHLPLSDGLRFADQATYRAKADGRDRIQLYTGNDLAA
jgi:diguanylate cyclase (GGDEF)-like protein